MTETVELELRELTKRYSPEITIGPISLDVKEGEFFSLLGPSGCGKTTVLRCIAGFETVTDGEIRIGGQRIDGLPPNRRNVGLVFQSYALFPHLTVFDNIAFGLTLRRASKSDIEERVRRMLALVDLSDLGARYPAQLSGGQQQRIAIARSLVLEPQLLLFDEPLSNLDYKLRVQMRQELRDLQHRLGKTSIYVTHDQSEALVLSDRIAVLSQGRIEQIGTPREIYEQPKSAFVAEFIGGSNLIPAKVHETDSDAARVATECGLQFTTATHRLPAGTSVLLMIRPERVRLLGPEFAAQGEPPNKSTARIQDVAYLGEDLHLKLLVGDAQPMTTSLKSGLSTRNLAVGGSIQITIDPEDIQLLPGRA